MTTDPFTEAARAEAERYSAHPGVDPLTLSVIDHAMHMAEWARTHLAAQEGHRRVRKYADDWDTCTCGYDAWPCRSQEPTDAERAVRELHCQYRTYGHENDCPDTSDEHREAHHHEDSDGYGENYCYQLPIYTLCDHCRDEDGERLDYPCPTIRALD